MSQGSVPCVIVFVTHSNDITSAATSISYYFSASVSRFSFIICHSIRLLYTVYIFCSATQRYRALQQCPTANSDFSVNFEYSNTALGTHPQLMHAAS